MALIDPSKFRQVQAQATLPSSAASDSGAEPTQSSSTGDQLQPPTQAPAQQPMQLQPSQSITTPATPSSPNKMLHGFIGSVLSGTLSALAGRPATAYETDSEGRTVPAKVQPKDTPGRQLARLASHSLEGLAAGASVPPQKSGLASALAGMGAGASAVTADQRAMDDKAKKEARENQEAAEQKKMRMYQNAYHNAMVASAWQHMTESEQDRDPARQQHISWAKAAEDSGVPVKYVTEAEAHQIRDSDPQAAAKYQILPVGMETLKDGEGNVIMDESGKPKMQGKFALIDGLHDGNIAAPASFVSELQTYGQYAGLSAEETAGLRAGDDLSMAHFVQLAGKIQEGKKKELEGWAQAEDGFGGADGKTPGRINKNTGEFKPNAPGVISAKQKETLANVNDPRKTGAVTDLERFKQQNENYRAELSKQTAKADSNGKQGATELQKQADDYSKFLFTAQSAKSSIANAKDGDQLANSLGPLQTALLVTSANGVHRINMTEVEAAGPHVGSVARRVDASLEKAGKGKLPAATLSEMQKLVDLYAKSKYGAYIKNAAYTAKLRGLDPATTPVFDQDGNTISLGDAMKNAPQNSQTGQVQVTDPSGGVHTFPDQASADKFKKLAGIK